MAAITTAIKETISAIQDRISGHLFLRRSASQMQSQCGGEPAIHPPVACASCSRLISFNSLGYPTGMDGVGEDMLAAYEKVSADYLASMSHNGLLADDLLRRDLTQTAYLACFAVPELVAEVRRLRADKGEG